MKTFYKRRKIAGLTLSLAILASSMNTSFAENYDSNNDYKIVKKTVFNYSDKAGIYSVNATALNVRTAPGENNQWIGSLVKDEEVEVIDFVGDWAKIKFEGKEAYCSAIYLTKERSITYMTVTGDTYLREKEDWQSKKIFLIKKGAVVEFVSKNDEWVKVKCLGEIGYLSPDYIKEINAETDAESQHYVTSNSCPVREYANNNSPVKEALRKGTPVRVLESYNTGWSKIAYNNPKGYMYIKTSSIGKERPDTSVGESYYVVSNGGQLKEYANNNAPVIKTLAKGTSVKVLDTYNSGWSKVACDNSKGYMYIKTSSIGKERPDTSAGENYYVVSNGGQLKEYANNNAPVIKTLAKGTSVKVLDTYNSGWSKVACDNSKGYMYIKTSSIGKKKLTEDSSYKRKVVAENLNVRKGPNTEYDIIGKLQNGDVINVFSEKDGWAKIEFNGSEAYCSSKYLDKNLQNIKKYKVNASNLNVRKGPSTEYDTVGKLENNSIVEVYSIDNGWAKIEFNGSEAYCSGDYLSELGQGPVSPNGKIVFIDAGHGGHDSGARGTYYGVLEKDATLDVSRRLIEKLKAAGYDVRYSRNTDVYIPLSQRTGVANSIDSTIFVSIHFNSAESGQAKGIETLYKLDGRNSNVLADKVQDNIIEDLDAHDRGIKQRPDLYVLRNSDMPAILVEGGFVSNKNEEGLINSAAYRDRLATSIMDGINEYFNLN